MNVQHLAKALASSWGEDTVAPGIEFCGPLGQCAVTALVVQDLLGGELVRAQFADGSSHYWNRFPGIGDVDLTRAQYPDDLAMPVGVVVPRSRLLDGPRANAARTGERYILLRCRVDVYARTLADQK